MENINKTIGNLLKGQIVTAGLSYKDVSIRLNKIGVKCSENSLATKLNRGTFSASFYLSCLSVIGVDNMDMSLIKKIIKDKSYGK